MSSSAPRPNFGGGGGGGGGSGGERGRKDDAVAKTAGFLVFSGIVMSIIKALAPKSPQQTPPPPSPSAPLPPRPSPSLPPPPHESSKKAPVRHEVGTGPSSTCSGTVEIVKGDTLWGFSRKYGVSVEEIKKANGLTADTIYAGKKLVIP